MGTKTSPCSSTKEEPETEPQQQLSEQDDITVTVAEEDQLAPVDKNKQCLNNQFGIEIVECDENIRIGMGYKTTIELKPIPKS